MNADMLPFVHTFTEDIYGLSLLRRAAQPVHQDVPSVRPVTGCLLKDYGINPTWRYVRP